MKRIIISPKKMHKNLLAFYRQKDPFVDVKVITKESLSSDIKGKLDPLSLVFLIKEFHLAYDGATSLLRFLPYVNESLPYFNKYREALEKKGFIKTNKYIKQFFKDNEVLIIGYSNKDKELLDTLDELSVKYQFVKNEFKKLHQELLSYETVVDEVFYSLNKIAELLDSGVSIDNIYIYVNSDSYLYYLDKFSPSFGFKVDVNNDEPLFNYSITNIFLKTYIRTKNVEEALNALEVVNDKDLLNAFKDVISSSIDDLDFSTQLDYFIGELRRTKYKKKRYNNVVHVIDEPIFSSNAHIFVLGFTQGNFPKTIKDNQLLSDNEKALIGLNTSFIKNECIEDTLLDFFSSNNKFYFSFAARSLSQKFYISPLAEKLDLSETKPVFPSVIYSRDMRDFYFAKALDLKKYYQEITPDYLALSKISNIPYDTYDNSFTGVNVFNNNMYLEYSYSKISMFYQCPFQYYISKVLSVDPFEDNFNTKLGTVVHAIFEKHRDIGFDFDKEFDELVKGQDFSFTELPIIYGLKEQIKEASDAILLHYRYMKNPSVYTEKEIKFPFAKNSYLTGKIDKIISLNDEYLAIVDYKTGNTSFNSDNIEFGDSLQLPIYCYLVENDKDFKDIETMGVFINNVIDRSLTRDPSDESLINPYFRLNGKVIADERIISYLDNTISGQKCDFITNVKRLKSGDLKISNNLVSSSEIKDYIKVAREKVIEADKRIRNNEFTINPLYIGTKGACQYCNYRDICFVKPNQRNYAVKQEGEDEDDE